MAQLPSSQSVMLLIGLSNAGFLAHYSVWKFRILKHIRSGIHPLGQPAILLLIFFLVLAALELVVLIRSFKKSDPEARLLPAIGFWLLQFGAIRFVFLLLEGI